MQKREASLHKHCLNVHNTALPYIKTKYIQSANFFSVKHTQFVVKNTFKAICFSSTEPSSGLFVRTLRILNVLAIGYESLLTKRPDDGSVEPKHVALNVYLTINWMCLTEKICTLYIFRNT